MAAPTNAAYVKKALANSEPSTHGTLLPPAKAASCPQLAEGDIRALAERSGFEPTETLGSQLAVMHNALFPITLW